MKINDEFFELLCLNSSDKLRNFLLENGKQPKAKCPVQFVNLEEIEDERVKSEINKD